MPRPLSNPEYAAFTSEVDRSALELPPWGGIVYWQGIYVLIYETAPPVGEPFAGFGGDLYLSDISDIVNTFSVAPSWEWNAPGTWAIWRFPVEPARFRRRWQNCRRWSRASGSSSCCSVCCSGSWCGANSGGDVYDDIIQAAASTFSVPVPWIEAVIDTESSWDPWAHVSGDGYGLMQLLESTARGLGFTGNVSDLFIPEVNIPLGVEYLGQLIARYGLDFRRVYSAYNSGNPDLWQTSTEVAAHVARAEAALLLYQAPAGGAAAVLVLLLFFFWRH